MSPPLFSRGIFHFNNFASYYANFFKVILIVPTKTRACKKRGKQPGSKQLFPWRSTWGDIIVVWGKVNISRNAPLHQLCGRGPQCDRQGKSFPKPFNLTLAAVFLTSDLYLLSHLERLEISKKVALPPETPPKCLPLKVSGGNFRIQQLTFTFC